MPTAGRPAARQAASTAVLTAPLSVSTATSSVRWSVTRRPSIMVVESPSFSESAVVCGPPPWTSTTRMPNSRSTLTWSASARSAAGSPQMAPPALMTKT